MDQTAQTALQMAPELRRRLLEVTERCHETRRRTQRTLAVTRTLCDDLEITRARCASRPPQVRPATNGRSDSAGLTPRQLEILQLVAEGLPTKLIARRLWLSPATVRNHVAGILTTLDAHSRLEALAKARRLGLLRQ